MYLWKLLEVIGGSRKAIFIKLIKYQLPPLSILSNFSLPFENGLMCLSPPTIYLLLPNLQQWYLPPATCQVCNLGAICKLHPTYCNLQHFIIIFEDMQKQTIHQYFSMRSSLANLSGLSRPTIQNLVYNLTHLMRMKVQTKLIHQGCQSSKSSQNLKVWYSVT